MPMSPAAAVVAVAAVVLAGCLTAPASDEAGGEAAPATRGAVSPARNVLVGPDAGAATPSVSFALKDVGVSAFEPTLGVTSTGSIFLIADTSVLKSTDHGLSWTNVALNAAGNNVPPTTLDPMLFVDPVTDRVFTNHLYLACTYTAWSDDEGANWVANPATCGLPGVDHQTLAAGPSVFPAPAYGDRVVVFCANQLADATCAISLDGGATFPITRPLFVVNDPRGCGGITGHVAIGPDGTIYVPAWHCDEPWIAISRDGGLSWESFRVAPDVSSGEMDPSVAADSAGNVYYFWMDLNGQPHFTRSTDQGRTWSPALNVSFDGLTVANLPSIVAGDPGRVAFTYIATTQGKSVNPADVDDETPWHLYVTISTDALSEDPAFTTVGLTAADSPIHKGPCSGGYRCGSIVDFMDITMGPDGRVYAASVDSVGTGNGVLGVLVEGPSLLASDGQLAPPPGY